MVGSTEGRVAVNWVMLCCEIYTITAEEVVRVMTIFIGGHILSLEHVFPWWREIWIRIDEYCRPKTRNWWFVGWAAPLKEVVGKTHWSNEPKRRIVLMEEAGWSNLAWYFLVKTIFKNNNNKFIGWNIYLTVFSTWKTVSLTGLNVCIWYWYWYSFHTEFELLYLSIRLIWNGDQPMSGVEF